ncbi:MAG: tRNA (adenosine(37)-N6)-threonylcarbamoyltransferase complex dimerization subunit type 1 TsaB [Treponema sp.]|nr:tRNA (adenosine(37)-N6)-threonylcarbamoyltransferase complex dimerization subunit type 1 TsaB [Treponema sp.]
MNLLAIDCAGPVLSVAVSNGQEIFYSEIDEGTKHSELVMDLIDAQMKKASLNQNDLNGVLCMGGPGSFTGLRIGYSSAKGLTLALSIPFFPVPTLDCIALNAGNLTLAVIEARKNAYFYSFFLDNKRITPDSDASSGQISSDIISIKNQYNEKIILTGHGADILYESLPDESKENIILKYQKRGFAKELILIAQVNDLFNNDCSKFLFAGPEYIRKTDAELSLSGQVH